MQMLHYIIVRNSETECCYLKFNFDIKKTNIIDKTEQNWKILLWYDDTNRMKNSIVMT